MVLIVMTVWLFVISIMDVRSRSVPVWMLAGGGACIVLTVLYQCGGGAGAYLQALTGAIPGIFLLVFGAATGKAGYGDGIVVLLAGLVLRDGRSFLLFGISLFLIALFSVILFTLKKAGRRTKIPYLPFLTAAWLLIAIM